MASFNLVNQPFVPCIVDGTCRHLNLLDTLTLADKISEIRDESPLVTAALHRFLIAVIHRVLKGPKSDKRWRELWEGQSFPKEEVKRYLSEWAYRFDLFDSQWPFFQASPPEGGVVIGTHQLVIERSKTHCKKHFSHTDPDSMPRMMPDEAARQLIAHQAFAPQGGAGYQSARTANAIVTLIKGNNLFETLCLNLVRYPDDQIVPQLEEDKPIWERTTSIKEDTELPSGYTDYLTWSFRRIRLNSDDTVVTSLTYSAGRWLEIPDSSGFLDPMVGYRRNEKEQDQPVRFDPKKSVWRDVGSLLSFTDAGFKPAKILSHTRKRIVDNNLSKKLPVQLMSFGFYAEPAAKVNFWRHETLPLPLEYLTDDNLVSMLKSAICIAEEIGSALRMSVATFAKLALTADPSKSPDKNRQWQMVDAVGADSFYWSRLETPFREFLVRLPGETEHQRQQFHAWFFMLKRTALEAYREAAELPQLDARGQRAAIDGESQLQRSIGKIRSQHHIPKEVTA